MPRFTGVVYVSIGLSLVLAIATESEARDGNFRKKGSLMRRGDRLCLFLVLCVVVFPTTSLAITINYDQCGACGSTGGPALQMIFQGLNDPSVAALGLVNTSVSFDPSTIANIDISVDKDNTDSQATPFAVMFQSAFHPLIEQDGIIYTPLPGILGPKYGSSTKASTSFTSGWHTISM